MLSSTSRGVRRQRLGFRPVFVGSKGVATAQNEDRNGNSLRESGEHNHSTIQNSQNSEPQSEPKHKTQAQLDEELRLKLEGISGDGGGSGVEYEGGKAVGLKRGVRENMFRVV